MTSLGANPEMFGLENPRGETVDTIDLIMKNGEIYKNTIK